MSCRRVLYVQRTAGGGSAISLMDILRCLDRDRFDPVVLLYQESTYAEQMRELGARVLTLGGGRSRQDPAGPSTEADSTLPEATEPEYPWRTWRELSRLVRKELPIARRITALIREEDIALVHHNNNPRANRSSILAARMARRPQVCHVRFLPDYSRLIDRRMSRWVGFYAYVSEAAEQKFRHEVGVSARRGEVLLHPIDVDALAPTVSAVAGIREEFGLQSDTPLISNVGRLVSWKGQHVFVDAMAAVVKHRPQAIALIVGTAKAGPEGEDYEESLKRRVRSHGLEQSILFTGFRSDAAAIMSASDIVVHTATEPEPFGRVVVEAMAVGRPVIATAAAGPGESVDPGRTGMLVQPGSPEDLAAAIKQLLTDPDARVAMGLAAKEVVRERHRPDRFARRLHEIYEMVIGASPSGGVQPHVKPTSPIGGIQHAN